MAMSYPPIFINKYLSEKTAEQFELTLPILTVFPADIDALSQTFPDSQGMFAVYDRMFKYRRTPFPHIKSEQLLYYFYKMQSDAELMVKVSQELYDLLDREDESGEEINAWIRSLPRNPNGTISFGNDPTEFNPIFFHKIKVYQLEETRDIVDFGTARTYAGNKIIIDYDYHQVV